MKFLFPQGSDQAATGSCSSPSCEPVEGTNYIEVGDSPWTLSLSGSAMLRITDAFLRGDSFAVYDKGQLRLTTPTVNLEDTCGMDPESCYGLVDVSWGSFILSPGEHSLTIRTVDSPYQEGGAAYFRIDRIVSTPEPVSLMLLGLGLMGLGAVRRSRG
jgi:hypothetical protein